jgi:hypothetical protein
MGGKYTRPSTSSPSAEDYASAAEAYDEILALRTSSRNPTPTPLSDLLHGDPALDLTADGFFINRNRRPDEIDPSKDVRLGWTTLTVPPEEIDVIEDRYNEEVDILRGRGSALVKTGRGHIRIRMPLRFANFTDANLELRPIVAQFRTCPFTMLESDTAAVAVLLKQADTGSVEAIQNAREAREGVLENYQWVKGTAIKNLGSLPYIRQRVIEVFGKTFDELAEELNDGPPSEIRNAVSKMMAFYTKPRSEGGLWSFPIESEFIQQLQSVQGHADDADKLLGALFDRSRELAEAELRASFSYPSVPVALHQLVCQTVPGYPELLRADLEMFYFNTEPFMPVTTFVGPTGNPTGDIMDCQLYWDHVEQRLGPDARHRAEHVTINTGLGLLNRDTSGLLSLEYPTTRVTRVKKDTPRLSDQAFTVPPPIGSDVEDDFEYRAVPELFLASQTDENIIVDQVTVSLENKLSPQPIEGHMYGTLQYMGQMNAKIQIKMTVTGDDEFEMASHLQKIHEIKKQTEEVAHAFGEKMRRNVRIAIEHDLVRLFGVHHVLLDRIRTKTKAINTVEVTLDLTEYTTSLEKRERLLMTATGAKTKIRTETVAYLADVAGAYLHDHGSAEAMNIVSRTWDGARWAADVMYGGIMAGIRAGHEIHGILNEDVVAEILDRMPAVKEDIGRRLRLWGEYEALKRVKKGRTRYEKAWLTKKAELVRKHGSWEKVPDWLRHSLESDAFRAKIPSKLMEIDFNSKRDKILRGLAKEHIKFWSTRKVRTPGLTPESDGPQSTMDSEGIIEIPPVPTRQMIEDAVTIIQSGDLGWKISQKLGHTVDIAQSIFTTLRARITEIREASQPSLVYPDLDLPDYATAFAGLWAAIKVQTGVDIANLEDLNEANLTPKVKAVVRRVVPTYGDLGIRIPSNRESTDFARKITDLVDPDYYFFWNRLKDNSEMARMLDVALQEAENLDSKLTKVDPSQPDQNPNRADLARAKTEFAARMVHGDQKPVNTDKYEDDPSPKETIVEAEVVGETSEADPTVRTPAILTNGGIGVRFKYRSAHPDLQKDLEDINPYDSDYRRRLFKAAVDSVPDRFRRMVTAFPAFKVQLVETDAEEWMLWDDFYGYNSIKSIRIHNHKYTPAIAEIDVVNVTGNLDEERAVSSDQERDEIERRYRTGGARREENTGEPAELDHFFLDAGTPLTVRLGYSSKLEELEVRFVGQVVSVSAGDVTRLVAQCYSSELTVPLNEVVNGRNWFAIANRIMDKSPTLHYGAAFEMLARGHIDRRGTRNAYTGWMVTGDVEAAKPDGYLMASGDQAEDRSRSLGRTLASVLGYLPSLPKRYIGEILANRKTINVFLPLENNWRRAVSEGSGPPWGIPNITGLEALHEMARYLPGFVCATRPYETQSGGQHVTLFFGRPEQPYTYTANYLDEEEDWLQAKSQAKIEAEDKTSELLARFFASRFGDQFQNVVSIRKGGAAEGTIKALSRGWLRNLAKMPTRPIGMFTNVILGWSNFGDSINNWAADIVWKEETFKVGESDSRTSELRRIEERIGRDGLHTTAGLFFNRYNNSMLLGGKITAAWVRKMYGALRDLGEGTENLVTLDWWDLIGQVGELTTLDGGPPPPPGTLLYNYFHWHSTLEAISRKNGTSEDDVAKMMRQAFEEYDDETRVIPTLSQRVMPRRYMHFMANSVINWSSVWKDFLAYFDMFLQAESNQDFLDTVYSANSKANDLRIGPRMKRFRNHHFAHSAIDIIKNGITTSQEFMANRVVVGHPTESRFKKVGKDKSAGLVVYQHPRKPETYELGYNDDIQPSDARVRVITEPNATNEFQARFCAKSNLSEALRPMYRGQIFLRGHEKVWPYDVVWLNDEYNGIYGPVEVESVVDHMDSSGYHVGIVPHALVINENGSEYADAGAGGLFWTGLTAAVATSLAVPTFGTSLWAGAALLKLKDNRLNAKTGKGLGETVKDRISGWLIGQGISGGEDPGVRIVPLIRRGAPWTSGLRGIGTGGWKARIAQRWEDIKAGWGIFKHNVLGD